MNFVVFVTVFLGHLAAFVITIPAIMQVKHMKIQVKRTANLTSVMRSMPVVGINFVISVIVGWIGTYLTSTEAVMMNLYENIPTTKSLAVQSVFFLLAGEIIFYYVHRCFHENKRLYALIHKLHHTWTAPVAAVTTYAHPLEHIFCNLATVTLPPALLCAHPAVSLAHSLGFQVFAAMHHSGYWWTDDLGMHDLHHEVFNVNYGPLGLLDYMHGTFRDARVSKKEHKS
jgi:methylsterol monooxygenase